MRRWILVLAVSAAAAGAAVLYQTAARQRAYKTLLERGDAALNENKTFAAMEAYSGAIAFRPDSMLAYLRRGQTYHRRADSGDLELAARDFRTAAALDPASTRPLEELGDVLYQLGQFDRAADAFERSLRLDDRSARVTLKLAFARYHDGNVGSAIATVSQVLKLDDKLADAHYLRALCLRDRARRADALAALEKAVALAPASIPIREELADLYGSLDRRADELVQLQLLAGLDRTHVERQIAVGLAHARSHRWELAILTLTNALERASDDPAVYGALGRVWLDASRARDDATGLAKAREALERAASSPSATSEILTLYGRALSAEGDEAGAERALQQASERYPIDPDALLLYANASERRNHLVAAREALIGYGALVTAESDMVARVGRIAAISLRLHEPDVALTWLKRAQSTNPGDARLVAALADAERARDTPRAR